MLAAHHDPEADLGQVRRNAQEQRVVAVRVSADGHNVDRHGLRPALGKLSGIDAERNEDDTRREAVPGKPAPKLVRLVLTVREPRRRRSRALMHRGDASVPELELREAFREPDRYVDERGPEAACTP